MSTLAESRSCDAHSSQEPTDTAAPARWLSHQVLIQKKRTNR
jgi:hypothetical protein